MTISRSPVRGGSSLPSLDLRGTVPGLPGAVFAFSDRADGTMSARVGEGDHRLSRRALVATLGGSPGAGAPAVAVMDVAWMDQVHGAAVQLATAPADPPPACDGIITTTAGLAVGVLVADCVPVLLAAPSGVAAVHAGRAGVATDVTGRTLERLAEATGDRMADMTAIIGPAIGPCCYEVPADMAREIETVVPGTSAVTTWGTPALDLIAGVTGQLRARGVGRIHRAGGCTRCDGAGRWFSHRASTGQEGREVGRQAGIIARRGAAGPHAPSGAPAGEVAG